MLGTLPVAGAAAAVAGEEGDGDGLQTFADLAEFIGADLESVCADVRDADLKLKPSPCLSRRQVGLGVGQGDEFARGALDAKE